MEEDKPAITLLLQEISAGNRTKVNQLIPLLYDELYNLASRQLYGERAGHTLNPTALIHEAYFKLIHQEQAKVNDRYHFFALAAQAMRRISVDYARSKNSQKRGGEKIPLTFVKENIMQEIRSDDLLALDESLQRLRNLNERQSLVVEYWFFCGLTHEEIAEVLGISLPSVRRDWRLARAWLSRELKRDSTILRPIQGGSE